MHKMTDEGKRPQKLREVWTIGESLPTHLRAIVREAWGVEIVDVYSSQEFGYIALQCPVSGDYHVQSESVLVEVLNDEGSPCGPGEIGRLVITSLHNFAFPLIRYEIGDYAEVGQPCSCGRGLATLRRIVGRTRNMLRLPNGDRRWSLVGFREFVQVAPIRQFQLVQKSLQLVEATFVVERPLTSAEEQKVKDIVQNALGHKFEIVCVYAGHLVRAKSGKFEEFICQVTDEQIGEVPT